jgi:acetyl esterase/lipase
MGEDILSLPPPPADVRLPYGSGPNQFGDLRLPKGKAPAPVVLMLHGGYWRAQYNLLHTGHLCAALTALGFATWNVEYRRVGDEGGGWPGTLEDVADAYRFVPQFGKRYPIDSSKVLVMGHSAGGQLALCMAAHQPSISRVVSLAGVLDLERAYTLHLSHDAVAEFLGGTPRTVVEHYQEADPMKLSIPKARQAILLGTSDEVVPPDFSRMYAKAKKARGEEVALIEIANADHFDLIDPRSPAWTQVAESIQRLVAS